MNEAANNDKTPEYLTHGLIIFIIYTFATLVSGFSRTTFLDVKKKNIFFQILLSLALLTIIFFDYFDENHIKSIAYAFSGSLLYDFIWLRLTKVDNFLLINQEIWDDEKQS